VFVCGVSKLLQGTFFALSSAGSTRARHGCGQYQARERVLSGLPGDATLKFYTVDMVRGKCRRPLGLPDERVGAIEIAVGECLEILAVINRNSRRECVVVRGGGLELARATPASSKRQPFIILEAGAKNAGDSLKAIGGFAVEDGSAAAAGPVVQQRVSPESE